MAQTVQGCCCASTYPRKELALIAHGKLWGRKAGWRGVFEVRIDSGPGYRLYYALRGKELVLLLVGGDKSSQQRDIVKAKKLNQEYE